MALVIAYSVGEFTVIEYTYYKLLLWSKIGWYQYKQCQRWGGGGGGGGGEDTDK